MKIPEEAPDWITIDWHQIPMSENIPNVVQKANKEYLYWDKIKYIAPEGVKKEH